MSTTSEPESDEVAKNSTTTMIASTEASTARICGTGRPSISTKIAVSASAVAKGWSALLARTCSKALSPTGANRTPPMNERIVRP